MKISEHRGTDKSRKVQFRLTRRCTMVNLKRHIDRLERRDRMICDSAKRRRRTMPMICISPVLYRWNRKYPDGQRA